MPLKGIDRLEPLLRETATVQLCAPSNRLIRYEPRIVRLEPQRVAAGH
jgi:hypothetical protein